MFEAIVIPGWLRSALDWLYGRLTRNDPPRPVDLIFVFAGRMERKEYGLKIYRAGLASRLLLSVGRFEVSKMRAIGFEKADELIAYRDRIPACERHFFCEISASSVRVDAIRLPQWNTYGELEALREIFRNGTPLSVMFLSTDIHMRRVAMAFERVFRGVPLQACFCAVPPACSSLHRQEWWTRSRDRRAVLLETAKLAAYRAILILPAPLVRRIMRLKHRFR
jgi:hypothetical protein